MDSCNNIPIEFYLATTDSTIYNKEKKWLWNGQMFWYINCLEESPSDDFSNTLPNIDGDSFIKLVESPSNWNFCNSQCNNSSKIIQIIFTFNPNSKDPKDYLQYVIDIYRNIMIKPFHNIKDNNGQEIYLNIDSIDKMIDEQLYEIWISKIDTVKFLEPINKDKPNSNTKSSLWLYILLIIVLMLFIVGGSYFLYNSDWSNTIIDKIAPTYNIG